MMTGKTTLSTLAAPPPKDCETRRRRAHELELPKAIESDSLSVGEAVIRRMRPPNDLKEGFQVVLSVRNAVKTQGLADQLKTKGYKVEARTVDASVEVRHKTVAALARFIGRDGRAGEAIAHAAHHDPDPAIRVVAQDVVDSGQSHLPRRKRTLRDVRRASRRAGKAQTISADNPSGP
jgi:hypothetical protein